MRLRTGSAAVQTLFATGSKPHAEWICKSNPQVIF